MNKYNYSKLRETLYHEKLDNGLNVYLLPKRGFYKSFATLSTNLGSIHTQIKDNNNKIIDLPLGIAHFLEHKLFEQNNKDVSLLFSQNQARVNAFTQNNRTTYLFSCTDKLPKNIETLLNFVQNPKFTTVGVEKEKSIISQEIKMFEDDPNTVAYMTLLKNMYSKHPIRNEILGSIESVNSIDVDILTKTHQTFYHPNNMVLFVTGNFEVSSLMSFIKDNQKNTSFKTLYKPVDIEPEDNQLITKKDISLNLEISIPNFLMGIKQKPTNYADENIMKKELIMAILTDLVFGKSSSNYRRLLESGLINDSFGIDITFEDTYGYLLIGSETNLSKELKAKIEEIFINLESFKIEEADFLRTKRQIIGGFIQALNSLEYIANQFTKYYYVGSSLFDVLNVSDTITIEDIEKARNSFTDKNNYSSITVYPKKNDA